MKKENPDAYELFYMELPQADYLNDIEIQDEYEDPPSPLRGLSDEQVSEIARDSLNAAEERFNTNHESSPPDPNEPTT